MFVNYFHFSNSTINSVLSLSVGTIKNKVPGYLFIIKIFFFIVLLTIYITLVIGQTGTALAGTSFTTLILNVVCEIFMFKPAVENRRQI